MTEALDNGGLRPIVMRQMLIQCCKTGAALGTRSLCATVRLSVLPLEPVAGAPDFGMSQQCADSVWFGLVGADEGGVVRTGGSNSDRPPCGGPDLLLLRPSGICITAWQ